ncbi:MULTISPECIES: ATP-binding cassette domain-containing protein [Proteus]|uniref:ATP-binding cassette domain-containing protein n=3 Tax=Enterobacterales TaxID=91347 RepID=A0A6G6SX58_9GAMM|nr:MULTISPECIES: ATP-binding cassette domain-containing protein [Proteus]ATM99433.1 peptide ABC transporter ATP-binding protein [Proteus vulgaris]MBG2838178.1 ATP-binding cassette domain-containing protein [Proteus terrae subsp. cibarius]MBG2868159.1 ATP-binding cassette domain-containing protein [Proteus terrae subsp. cibarius]MBG2916019.1 ATP-binding cassette domain-containing protein [Proteus terrae subsp. cibarius]MBG5949310.1 ATP-binding cassette domain-containing protein [Proteus terrae]
MLSFEQLSIDIAQFRWLGKRNWQPLLKSISLDIKPGKMLALVGGSGEGKSLLLQSALGLLPANMRVRGAIKLNGHTLSERELIAYRGNTFCYIPQGVSALNPLICIGDQLSRSARLSGADVSSDDIVQQLGLYHLSGSLVKTYPAKLSGGMAKRVLACNATLSNAQYILADEITSWLDDEHACLLLGHLRELCNQGKSVLWVTHDLALAARFADTIAVLNQGEVNEVIPANVLNRHEGSEWLKTLWNALPEQQFINTKEASLNPL